MTDVDVDVGAIHESPLREVAGERPGRRYGFWTSWMFGSRTEWTV